MWLLAALDAAFALDPVWAVGGYTGTHILPNAEPITFPRTIRDGDGLNGASTIDKVAGDLLLGASGALWATGRVRFWTLAEIDLGRRYVAPAFALGCHYSADLGPLYALAGGGFGIQRATWRGSTDRDERLSVPSYPLRAEGGALIPLSDFVGLETELFLRVPFPLRHSYVDRSGVERQITGVPFAYTAVGLRLGVVYGQLK